MIDNEMVLAIRAAKMSSEGEEHLVSLIEAYGEAEYQRGRGKPWGERNYKSRKGSDNGNARLTESDVREIRALAKEGVSTRSLAMVYSVSQSHVVRIINREVWAHLD